MSAHDIRSAERPPFDAILQSMADYVMDYDASQSRLAMETARYCLMDSLACALMALDYPECTKLLGPVVPGAGMAGGSRVPGTSYELDPIKAAWDIGCLVRFLDFNDTWLAAEWGHPSDNLGAILGIADWLSRKRVSEGQAPMTMKDVLMAMVQAHELQGVTALENAFNRVGLDHVMLVRIASAGVAAKMLGGSREEVLNTLSHA
jgi:2-methylcitrate dehydratase